MVAPSAAEVQEFLRKHDKDGNGLLDEEEFVAMLLGGQFSAFLEEAVGLGARERQKMARANLMSPSRQFPRPGASGVARAFFG